MAELREVVTSLGHADVMTYIQSGNVLFTPRLTDGRNAGGTDTSVLAAELERAIADGIGVQARAVVLSGDELARCLRDNPYPVRRTRSCCTRCSCRLAAVVCWPEWQHASSRCARKFR